MARPEGVKPPSDSPTVGLEALPILLPGERPLGTRLLLWLAPNLTAFTASFCIMVLELVAGRVIARYLGQSLYTWTSVIGIVLAGITLGNLLGGRLADWFRPSTVLAVLFLLASGACVITPLMNQWVNSWKWSAEPKDAWFLWALNQLSGGGEKLPWSARIFGHVLVVFLLPSTLLGTIGPVVAKMALDQGRQIGRTVGNVYAWGALGSIAGTFITGFYLIPKFGTEALILSVGVVLGLVGIIYSLTRLWSFSSPQTAILSFFALLWAYAAPAAAVVAFLGYRGNKAWEWPFEWVDRGPSRGWVLTEIAASDVVYLDESQYSFIKIDRETEKKDGEDLEVRDLVLDNLIHAHYVAGRPTDLRYEYENIYKAITHRYAPPPTPAGAAEGRPLSALFIGGGGYIFPRYLRAIWPECRIEIAEIDPAVTAADIAEFGLPEELVQVVRSSADLKRADNPFWVYHMDARNHIEDLARQKDAGEPVPEFDYIYGDAFNDYAVPFHLTTREFNEKVKRLLKPGSGIYLINVIDIYSTGKFLGAVYNTFRETFGENVYVFSNTDGEPSKDRDTYIVVGSLRPLKLEDLPTEEEPYKFTGTLLTAAQLQTLTDDQHAGRLIITDDYAPVENFLQDVVNSRKW